MINNKEKKMIQRYCIYPKIAVVALIFSFVQCALIVPLEMIDDLVFQNKGFQPTGMFTALGFVIIYVIIFCFCALAPKFGMNGKKWKSLIGRLNVKQSETDYSKEVSAALASQAVGRFLKESDNDTAKNIGSAMQVAGAVSTVSTSIDMLSEAGSNAENMAHAYRIPIPDIKKQLIAFAVIPILIVVGTYIPQYIKGKQAMDQRIAASAKQVEIVKKALEPVCVRVHADNPNESRSRSSYTVMGYLRDSGATDCYVHVQVNNSGTIINISYVEGVDINKSLEENLMQTEKDFATLQKSFENLNVSVSNPEILSYQAIPQQFKDEFLNGTFYKSFRFYDQDAPISLSCSFDTETEDQFDEVIDSEESESHTYTDEEVDHIADTAIAAIQDILKYFKVGEVTIDEYEGDEGELILDITGDDLAVLIGRHGRTLDALQFLISSITSRTVGYRYPIVVDVEGYKGRQRQKLEDIARKAADRAFNQDRSIKLRPMTPYERRLIHIALRDDDRVETVSEGEGRARRVVVIPR